MEPVIALAADAVARDFAAVYVPHGDRWRRRGPGWQYEVVGDADFTADVRAWLDRLDNTGSPVTERLRELTAISDGWAVVIARRAMARLRQAAATPREPADPA